MNYKKITIRLVFVSALLALFLGWIDNETTSLWQLFSGPGNLLALLIYTIVFTAIGWLFIGSISILKMLFVKSKK